ncbi:MAG: FG-GAP repeat domain-containing protein [Methylococcales bacterium]
MWRYSERGSTFPYRPLPITIAGAPGVLVVGFSVNGSGSAQTLTPTALRRDGSVAWQRTFSGRSVVLAHRSTDLPFFNGVLRSASGDTHLLIKLTSSAQNVRTTQSLVLNGITGQELSRTTETVAQGGSPQPTAVGDLNGEGRADYVVASAENNARLTAYNAVNGAQLWRTTGVPLDFFGAQPPQPFDAGDVDRDGRPDLLFPLGFNTLLVDGRTGAVRWKRAGQGSLRVGDISGDGTDEVVAATTQSLFAGNAFTFELRHTAHDLAGNLRYDAVRQQPVPTDGFNEFEPPLIFSIAAGDVNADGVGDITNNLSIRLQACNGLGCKGSPTASTPPC